MIKSVNEYKENDIDDEETFSIKIWETEEDREEGESFIYLEIYTNREKAIEYAKRIISRQGYAYIEVISDNTDLVVFGSDGLEENYYFESKCATNVERSNDSVLE